MNKIFKLNLVALTMIVSIALASPVRSIAQYYGNEDSNPVLIVDKKIKSPVNGEFVDNVSKSDYLYSEGDQVEFSISVENRGPKAVYDVNLVDSLPDYLKMQFYFGVYSKESGKIEQVISVLNPGEVRNYSVIAKISDLPNSDYSKSLKLINKACVTVTNDSDCDDASFYTGLKTMPVTGGSDILMVNSVLIMSLMTGAFTLRKLVRGY